jgi:UDP-N-acetylmuramate: L-alanyl-gamma-D-glutamyl-meso-diaminopimelate ligase
MRMGLHSAQLAESLAAADLVFLHASAALSWDPAASLARLGSKARVLGQVSAIVEELAAAVAPGDRIVIMSNGGFEGIHQRVLERLGQRAGGLP